MQVQPIIHQFENNSICYHLNFCIRKMNASNIRNAVKVNDKMNAGSSACEIIISSIRDNLMNEFN